MASCPHCGNEVPFTYYFFNNQNYWKNLFRIEKIYTCNKCRKDFYITFGTAVIKNIIYFLLIVLIAMTAFHFIDVPKYILIVMMISFLAYEYDWWAHRAKVEVIYSSSPSNTDS